jgi:hypothetical protein
LARYSAASARATRSSADSSPSSRHADAGSRHDSRFAFGDPHRFDAPADSLGCVHGSIDVRAGQDREEFLATVAHRQICAAQLVAQRLRRRCQNASPQA